MSRNKYWFNIMLDYLKYEATIDASTYGCKPEWPYTLCPLCTLFVNGKRVHTIEVGMYNAEFWGEAKDGFPNLGKLSEIDMKNVKIEYND